MNICTQSAIARPATRAPIGSSRNQPLRTALKSAPSSFLSHFHCYKRIVTNGILRAGPSASKHPRMVAMHPLASDSARLQPASCCGFRRERMILSIMRNAGRLHSRRSVNVAHGLLDSFREAFQPKPHAPELVRIDMDSDGGLGGTSEDVFGPLAAVLVGYHPAEVETFRAFMIDMEADIVQLISCNGDLVDRTLRTVLESPTPDIQKPELGARRAVILSGMMGAEVSEVIGAYNDSGLPETVWAAAVPMNIDRRIRDLVQDIYGDHVYLRNNPDARPQ